MRNETIETHQDIIHQGIVRAHGGIITQLYEQMNRHGMSKRALADMVGDSSTMSSRTFNPNTNITLKTIVKNAEALDCDVEIHLVPKKR